MRKLFFVLILLSIFDQPAWSQASTGNSTVAMNAYIPYRVGSKWGYCDTLANVLVKPAFDSVGFFFYNKSPNPYMAVFVKNKRLGLMDSQLKPVIQPEFTKFNLDLANHNGLIMTYRDNKMGLFDLSVNREIFPAQYDVIEIVGDHKFLIVGVDQKYGLFSKLGQPITGFKFEKMSYMYDGYFEVIESGIKKYINSKGEGVIWDGEVYDDVIAAVDMDPFENETNESTQFRAITKKLKERWNYDTVVGFSNAPFCYKSRKGNLYGILHCDGGIIIEPQYEDIQKIYGSSLILIKKSNKFGLINHKLEVILPCEYDRLLLEDAAIFIWTQRGDKHGIFINNTIYPPIPAVYDEISRQTYIRVDKNNWHFQIFKVRKNGKFGFVGENGKEYFKE
jgi:WG containing repeat